MSKKRSSPSSSRGYSERKVATRELRKRFLILCEGEKTEPNYFRSFRVNKKVIDLDIEGLGKSPNKIVAEAVKKKEEDGGYDEVWCVFDRDSFKAQEFNQAIKSAEKENIKVAYSNEAFELWYLLHFNFYNTGVPREDYQKKLSKCLGYDYKKNSETIYEELESKQRTAIKNAKRLLEEYDLPNPAANNPSTTVHLLVEELNKFIPD